MKQLLQASALMTFAIAAALALPRVALSQLETGHGGPYGAGGGDSTTHSTLTTIFQCLMGNVKNDDTKKKFTPAIEAFTRAYDLVAISSSDKAQKVKKPSKLELQHLIAQILIETGYLESLTEKGKEGDQYSGRGYIQITGKDNYANCAKFLREVGGPYSQLARQIEAGGASADSVIGNRAYGKGMSSGALTPAALCTLAWWAEAKKSKELENALAHDGESAVETVSRIVNRGPGSKPGEKANNDKERKEAFEKVKSCTK